VLLLLLGLQEGPGQVQTGSGGHGQACHGAGTHPATLPRRCCARCSGCTGHAATGTDREQLDELLRHAADARRMQLLSLIDLWLATHYNKEGGKSLVELH